MRSTDNGSTFDNVTSHDSSQQSSGVIRKLDTFVAVGNSGNIVRSTDNGSSFDNVTFGIKDGTVIVIT